MARTPNSSLNAVLADSLFDYAIVAGSFVPAGTGTTAPTGLVGDNFAVTQTASGVFDVELLHDYPECVAFLCTAKVAGETTDVYAQAGDIVAASATAGEKHRIRTMTGGTPTSIHGDAAPLVSFVAIMRTSKKV